MRIRTLSGYWLRLGFLVFLSAVAGYASNVSAASCSRADVNTAVTAAADGDTVVIPACSATPWTTGISFCKAITIQGAGAGSTTLVSNMSGGNMFSVSSCTNKTMRFTAFTINNLATSAEGFFDISKCAGCTLRIDHTTLNGNGHPARIFWINGQTYGVVDHNTVTDMGLMVSQQAVGESDDNAGSVSWTQAPSFGTANAIYIEDNSFSFPNDNYDTDCMNGGRIVYRYNTFTAGVGSFAGPFNHGYDSVARSCFELDAYNNTIIGNSYGYMGIQFRGASGLVYNNLISGHWDGFGIGLTNYRSATGLANSHGQCNGTNAADQNTPPTASNYGWPCRDQVGRGTNQGSYPLYAWNNCKTALGCTPGGADAVPATAYQVGGAPDYTSYHIKSNRDFYDAVSSFNGTVGVGQGTLGARPSTCTTGVAYWGTDTSTLYKCTATNTWTSYYTPFPYPHPLQQTQQTIQPPTNLRLIVR